MTTAFMVVTNRCSRRCAFCFYSTGYLDYPAAEMGREETASALEAIAGMGVQHLIVTGGEPLERPDIMDILDRAARLGMTRLLLTNGERLDRRSIEGLAERRLEGITISVNSLVEAERLAGSAPFLHRSGIPTVTVTVVFSGANVGELEGILRRVEEMGWGVILQPAFVPPDARAFSSLSPRAFSADQWGIVEPLLTGWGKSQGARAYAEYILALYGRGRRRPRRCLMGTESFVVDCDGSAYPCFHRRDMHAGNVLSASAAGIGRRMRGFAAEVASASCYGEHCVSLFFGGPCD